MFSMLRKSLSGESNENDNNKKGRGVSKEEEDDVHPSLCSADASDGVSPNPSKASKRNRSLEQSMTEGEIKKSQKRKRLVKNKTPLKSDGGDSDYEPECNKEEAKLPAETPEWGLKMLEIIQGEFRNFTAKVDGIEKTDRSTAKTVDSLERKLNKVEQKNKTLESENLQLREKLLDLEYRQRRNNLVFDGIYDAPNELDLDCIQKLRHVVRDIPGLNVQRFQIKRCHRLDGAYKQGSTRRLICALNWHYDVQCILRNCKKLPRGIFVTEDLPEEWMDRRKILKPIYNTVKRIASLKAKTHLTKDKLIIDGRTFTTSPTNNNVNEANLLLDLNATCQHSDADNILFLGSHSIYSNMFSADFTLNNVKYSSVEQYIQSEKAVMFGDDLTHHKIMAESNPYKIKKLGSRVRNFDAARWRKTSKKTAHKGVLAKFGQNLTLRENLVNTGDVKIVESSLDTFWGTGLHLHDRNALDCRYWSNQGGAMSEILHEVRQALISG